MEMKEQKAREYAKLRYGNNGEETSNEIAKVQACTVGYLEGWDEALKSQWISVEDRLPDIDISVLVLTSNRKVSMAKRYQPKDCNGRSVGIVRWSGSSTFDNSIIAWMPIPSFDEIFNTNSHK